MSKTYTPDTFTTFETIAKEVYGSEFYAYLLRTANPHITGTGGGVLVPAGIPVFTPEIDPPSFQPSPEDEDDVTLVVDGKQIGFWESVSMKFIMDSISQVTFTIPFEHESQMHRDLVRPFTYKTVELFIGTEKKFRGAMIGREPVADINRVSMTLSAYASPGVLSDCTASSASFPIEFNDMKLDAIANQLCEPFSIRVEVATPKDSASFVVADEPPDIGPKFQREALNSGGKPWGFLAKLAQQRNLIMSNGSNGQLVFYHPITSGVPVAKLTDGASPVIKVTPLFSEQNYYSVITGIQPTLLGTFGGKSYPEKNPFLNDVFRPFNFSSDDSEEAEIKKSTQSKMSRMFGNMCSFTVDLDTWRDPQGKLWSPNTILELQAPNSLIYNSYKFVTRSVTLKRIKNNKTAQLNLVLPGSFSGKIPESLPWD